MRCTIYGPPAVNNSLPILKAPTAVRTSSTSFNAISTVDTSNAAIIGFRTRGLKRNSCEPTSRNQVRSVRKCLPTASKVFRALDLRVLLMHSGRLLHMKSLAPLGTLQRKDFIIKRLLEIHPPE